MSAIPGWYKSSRIIEVENTHMAVNVKEKNNR